jgi:uracil-DNA glycosylase
LFLNATQTVFGEGERGGVIFIGEQPGDQEDKAGKPFVGPAGQILDQALKDVGIDRSQCYVTNAVKHFTVHPSSILRAPDPAAKEKAFADFVADLNPVAEFLNLRG